MRKNFSVIFGGVVAYMLLLLYGGTVAYMTGAVILNSRHEASKDKDGKAIAAVKIEFKPGLVYVVTTIGGLVSALVVARLAITKPGENPATTLRMVDAGEGAKALSAWLTIAYLVGWLLTGLTALLVGIMFYPETNATLGEIGTTWLGLAVASGYAYFGLNPTS
jgi:hypothetical protein